MKFNTKKLSPIRLRPSNISSSFRCLDERDLVWRNPNKYITDENENKNEETDHCDENGERRGRSKDQNSYGRRVEHLPRLVYTPVKVSARTGQKQRGSYTSYSGTSPFNTRSVTDKEMDDLNASLINLRFCDDDDDDDDDDENNVKTNGHTNTRYTDTDIHTDGGDVTPLLGRIPTNHIDSKSGKTTIVWRSARASKTTGRS
jgi:hypothetical protein